MLQMKRIESTIYYIYLVERKLGPREEIKINKQHAFFLS